MPSPVASGLPAAGERRVGPARPGRERRERGPVPPRPEGSRGRSGRCREQRRQRPPAVVRRVRWCGGRRGSGRSAAQVIGERGLGGSARWAAALASLGAQRGSASEERRRGRPSTRARCCQAAPRARCCQRRRSCSASGRGPAAAAPAAAPLGARVLTVKPPGVAGGAGRGALPGPVCGGRGAPASAPHPARPGRACGNSFTGKIRVRDM